MGSPNAYELPLAYPLVGPTRPVVPKAEVTAWLEVAAENFNVRRSAELGKLACFAFATCLYIVHRASAVNHIHYCYCVLTGDCTTGRVVVLPVE